MLVLETMFQLESYAVCTSTYYQENKFLDISELTAYNNICYHTLLLTYVLVKACATEVWSWRIPKEFDFPFALGWFSLGLKRELHWVVLILVASWDITCELIIAETPLGVAHVVIHFDLGCSLVGRCLWFTFPLGFGRLFNLHWLKTREQKHETEKRRPTSSHQL